MTDLFSPHRDAVVRSLERRFGRELAEDAVQDALAAALVSGETPANPKAWLHVVAHRRAVDAVRGVREAPHAELPEVGAGCDAAEVVVLRERVRAVLRALHTIPGRQREALLLRSLEDRSYEEIGARLDVEPDNAKQLVSRGRRSLRGRVAGLLPAPLVARLAELAQVATGTAAGRTCAGLCVAAGAFASLSVEAPVVRELAQAPAATAEPAATPTATREPRRRATPTPAPTSAPSATSTPVPAPARTPAATPVATPVRTPQPTPTRSPKEQRLGQEALLLQRDRERCPRAPDAQSCEASVRERTKAISAELKAERQAKVATRIPKLTPSSSDADRALWLRRQYASGRCARTPEGVRACTEKLRAQPRAGSSKAS